MKNWYGPKLGGNHVFWSFNFNEVNILILNTRPFTENASIFFFSESDKYVLKRGDTMWWEARSSSKFHEFAIKLHFHYQLTTTQVVICILFWLSKKKSWLDDEPITILRRFSGLMRSSDALRIFFVSIIALPLIISFKPKRRKKRFQ